MKPFRWPAEKNDQLQANRGVSFERIVIAIENNGLVDVVSHPQAVKYPRQRIMMVAVDGYAHLVPFVEESDYYFLKTIIPSRKATRDYLNKDPSNEQA